MDLLRKRPAQQEVSVGSTKARQPYSAMSRTNSADRPHGLTLVNMRLSCKRVVHAIPPSTDAGKAGPKGWRRRLRLRLVGGYVCKTKADVVTLVLISECSIGRRVAVYSTARCATGIRAE